MSEIEEILVKIGNGEAISAICREYGITPYHYQKYLKSDSLFQSKLETAQQISAECKVDELIALADGIESAADAAIARVKSENIKWLATKQYREKYGEKMEVNVHQTLDLSKVLAAASARVAPILHQEKQTIDVTPRIDYETENKTTGLEPVASLETIDDLL